NDSVYVGTVFDSAAGGFNPLAGHGLDTTTPTVAASWAKYTKARIYAYSTGTWVEYYDGSQWVYLGNTFFGAPFTTTQTADGAAQIRVAGDLVIPAVTVTLDGDRPVSLLVGNNVYISPNAVLDASARSLFTPGPGGGSGGGFGSPGIVSGQVGAAGSGGD